MKMIAAAILCALSATAAADDREVQRALIQRDQQSAEFSAGSLRDFHARRLQLQPQQLRPDERSNMARESEAFRLTLPPVAKPGPDPDYRPSPLPGRQKSLVDPIPVQGVVR